MRFKKIFSSPLLALWLTVFIDLLGLGIVIPIFAALFFVPGSEFFLYNLSIGSLKIDTPLVYGLLIAAYPFAQFFGAPLLGDLSDRFGRKKLLLISILGTLASYVVIATGVLTNNILLLFLGRLADGFTGGNISVAQSAISDLSTKETKTRNFGLIGMAFGLGFVIGPYLGGKLADPTVVSWFTNATPFVFAGLLTFLNVILILFNLKETLHGKVDRVFKVNWLGSLDNVAKAVRNTNLRTILVVNLLFIFGFNFFSQFFQVYLISRFAFTQSQIGDLFAYIGIWIAITQGLILRPLAKKFKPYQFVSVSLLALGVAFLALLLPNDSTWIYFIIPIVAVFNGLTQPNLLTLVSNQGDNETQGELLGINQSVQSIAQMIPPIVSGVVSAIAIELPLVVAGLVTIASWVIFILGRKAFSNKNLSK